MDREPFDMFQRRLLALQMNPRQFCKKLGIDIHTFYKWKRTACVPRYACVVLEMMEKNARLAAELSSIIED